MSRTRASSPWTAPVYLDTSALVKLFVPEDDSDALNEALLGTDDVIISDLTLTEVASALSRRAREGALDAYESRRLHREAGNLADACRQAELTPPVHRHAERLLLTSRRNPLRAMDALHLALALESGASTFVTYDPRLGRAAASHGLFPVPEVPEPQRRR